MAEYTVNHRYQARRDGNTYGPYEPGSTVELEPADAEWVNRDSPDCLTAVAKPKPKPEPEVAEVPEVAGVEPDGEPEPAKDRAHRGGRKR